MGRDLLDRYSDYLLYSGVRTTAIGLSNLLEGEVSMTRSPVSCPRNAVRAFERKEARLIFDDTVIEKPYMDENEIVSWNYDYKTGVAVKGIDPLAAFYISEQAGQVVRLPIGFRVVAKTAECLDEKSGERKRKSPQTKNRMMRETLRRHLQNQAQFLYILADSWYSSAK